MSKNVKSNRLLKWESVSKENQYWNSYGARKIQEKKVKIIVEWLKKEKLKSFNVLEIRCGNGYVGLQICRFFVENNIEFKYCLSDIVKNCIEKAKKNFMDFAKKENVTFELLDVYKINKNTQDIIISTGFASVTTYKDAVPVVANALKEGGILICDFINHFSPKVFLVDVARSVKRLVNNKKYANDTSSKYYHFGRIGIKNYFEKHGLKLLKIKAVGIAKNPLIAVFKKLN